MVRVFVYLFARMSLEVQGTALSAAEAKPRGLPTRNENACVVNGHGDGLLGREDGECIP